MTQNQLGNDTRKPKMATSRLEKGETRFLVSLENGVTPNQTTQADPTQKSESDNKVWKTWGAYISSLVPRKAAKTCKQVTRMMTNSMVDKGRCEGPNLRAPPLPPLKQVSTSPWNPSKAQDNDGEHPTSCSGSPAAPRNGLQHGPRTPATSSQRWGTRNTHRNRVPVEPKGATGTLG